MTEHCRVRVWLFKFISELCILRLHSMTYALPAKGFPKCHMTQPEMLLRFKFIGIRNFSNIVCLSAGHRVRAGEHRKHGGGRWVHSPTPGRTQKVWEGENHLMGKLKIQGKCSRRWWAPGHEPTFRALGTSAGLGIAGDPGQGRSPAALGSCAGPGAGTVYLEHHGLEKDWDLWI